MAAKDKWDKFDIIYKVVVLGIIPIVIAYGADNIAQSLRRGELIQSLISDLAQPDAKRDVALIALDAAIAKEEKCTILGLFGCEYDPEDDQVISIASALIDNSIDNALEKGQLPGELEIAKKIISKRAGDEFYKAKYENRYREIATNLQRTLISDKDEKNISIEEKQRRANTAKTLAAIQPAVKTKDNLAGVRLVYIQYGSNEKLAKELQEDLQDRGVSAPGIEHISGISKNDIRYAGPSDRRVAENLQAYLKENHSIEIEKLIDLSSTNYNIPAGQVEIWLE